LITRQAEERVESERSVIERRIMAAAVESEQRAAQSQADQLEVARVHALGERRMQAVLTKAGDERLQSVSPTFLVVHARPSYTIHTV